MINGKHNYILNNILLEADIRNSLHFDIECERN